MYANEGYWLFTTNMCKHMVKRHSLTNYYSFKSRKMKTKQKTKKLSKKQIKIYIYIFFFKGYPSTLPGCLAFRASTELWPESLPRITPLNGPQRLARHWPAPTQTPSTLAFTIKRGCGRGGGGDVAGGVRTDCRAGGRSRGNHWK